MDKLRDFWKSEENFHCEHVRVNSLTIYRIVNKFDLALYSDALPLHYLTLI